jgi:hypothetical protein
MTKAFLLALLVLTASADTTFAEIRITVSRFENNKIEIQGLTAPNRIVTIDGQFKVQSDGGGYFDFKQLNYKPADCMSDISSGTDVYSAVIAGCFGEFSIEHEKPKTPAPPD